VGIWLVVCAFLALVAPWSGGSAQAQIFTISGIAVSAQAASADEAKKLAIADGQIKAYEALIAKLVRPEDAVLLPVPDEIGLQGLVSGFSLDKERNSPTQYLAEITVRFNPDAVELLLARAGITINVTQSTPVLIVPVVAGAGPVDNGLQVPEAPAPGALSPGSLNGGVQLPSAPDQGVQLSKGTGPEQPGSVPGAAGAQVWGPQNTWLPVWRSLALGDRLVPVILPLGDATDRQIDQAALLGADVDALSQLAARYGVEGAMVAILSINRTGGLVTAKLNGLGPDGSEMSVDRQVEISAGDEQKAVREVTLALLDGLDTQWQLISQGTSPEGSTQKVALQVPFGNLRDWVVIRRRLEATPGVRRIDVGALAAGGASIELNYSGEFRDLLTALDAQGLAIYDTGSRWELRAR